MLLKQDGSFFNAFVNKGSFKRAFVFLLSFTFASAGIASTILCKNDKVVRTLRSDKSPDGGCRAIYTKQGVDHVVGVSSRPNGCETILESVRKNLEGNIWKCKAVKESAVSNLSE